MSMNLMLQTESKRTLGGLLWLVFTLLSTFALWAFVDTKIEPENLFGYISLYLTITSFIVVAIITIRPEKKINKRVIGKTHVPPVFNASDAPSIYDVADSAFIAKELDSFYGNWLVLFGFLVGIFFPLCKLVEIIFELDITGIALTEGIKIITLFIFIILLYRELAEQKKDLREHILMILNGENQEIEFKDWKKESDKPNSKKYTKLICALANTEGGTILFGVDDNANPTGILKEDIDKIDQFLQNICHTNTNPRVIIEKDSVTIDDKIIGRFFVKKSKKLIQSNDERYYIRRGSTNRAMKPDEIEEKVGSF